MASIPRKPRNVNPLPPTPGDLARAARLQTRIDNAAALYRELLQDGYTPEQAANMVDAIYCIRVR